MVAFSSVFEWEEKLILSVVFVQLLHSATGIDAYAAVSVEESDGIDSWFDTLSGEITPPLLHEEQSLALFLGVDLGVI